MFTLDKSDISIIREVAKGATSRICGFIMYTRKDAFVAKVINDKEFWDALDDASGTNWPIFVVKPLVQGSYTLYRASEDWHINFMRTIWDEPNDNQKYLDFFGLDSSEKLPCFIAFHITDNDKIEQVVCKIKGDNKDETYKSIKEIVDCIAAAEKDILPEYKSTDSVFREVAKNLDVLKFRSNANRIVEILTLVKPLLGLVK